MKEVSLFRILFLCFFCGCIHSSTAQSGSFGNSFYHAGVEHTIHNTTHSFENGVIGTERAVSQGYLSFVGTTNWVNADDNKHVDGYVRSL